MDGTYNRRSLLRSGLAIGSIGISGCTSSDNEDNTESTKTETTTSRNSSKKPTAEPSTTMAPPTSTQTGTPTTTQTPESRDLHVSAYYYPWYDSGQDWLSEVPATPSLREYDSRTASVVKKHIEWSKRAGIDSWCINWAPTTQRGTWIEDQFIPAEGSQDLEFCMQPATLGRFQWEDNRVNFDDGYNRRVLREDLELFERRYFGESNYLRIDGRPVVYYFSFLSFEGDVRKAFEDAIAALDEKPYLIADARANSTIVLYEDRLQPFDAVSPYNPYDPTVVENSDFDTFLHTVENRYLQWSLATENSGHNFHPTVIPGYDDTMVRPEAKNPILERSPDRFRQLCRVGRKFAETNQNVVFLTSFNEWPEYTAVEPAESYGSTYLDVTHKELTETSTQPAAVSYAPLVFDFNETIDLVDGPGGRPISLMLGSLTLLNGDKPVVSYDIGVPNDEPVFVEGAYAVEQNESNDPSTWRWLGGPSGRAVLYCRVDAEKVDRGRFTGKPVRSDRIEATISFDGSRTDHVELGSRRASANNYTASLQ